MKQFVYIFFLILSAILLTSCDPNEGSVDPVDPEPPQPPKKVEITITVNITYINNYRLHKIIISFFKADTFSYSKLLNFDNVAPPQVVYTFSFEGDEASKLIGLEAKVMTSTSFILNNYVWGTITQETNPFIVKEGKNEVIINVVQSSG